MRSLLLLILFLAASGVSAGGNGLVVIGHAGVPKTDMGTLRRLYTGRATSIGEVPAAPVNLPAGHPLRERFLRTVLGQSEDQYTGYWVVRRYVGKGAPPIEVPDPDAMLKYVQATPGAVGYFPLGELPPGINVIYRP